MSLSAGRVDVGPGRPSEVLLATGDLLAVRVHGKPRDPHEGRHKAVVVFTAATMTPLRLAAHLRDAADRLELQE